jgi:formylglycine-generating enzyme
MAPRPLLNEIEDAIVKLSSEQFGIPMSQLSLQTRLVQDLNIDSLDLIEWMMAVEEKFKVTLPGPETLADHVYKEVFTRPEFTLGDMAELVHLRWDSAAVSSKRQSTQTRVEKPTSSFTQLGGRLATHLNDIYRPIGKSEAGFDHFRRLTDGMVCVRLPSETVEIGNNEPDAGPDEQPQHMVEIRAFLMDREVVSTSAYCRFLNSIGAIDDETLEAWFWIAEDGRRHEHQLVKRTENCWIPLEGTEEWPMVLVTWHGANAYSLWANGADWRRWSGDDGTFLPSESQWEYGARGPKSRRWPWGDGEPAEGDINAGLHIQRMRYDSVLELPIAPVNELSGVSPFGLTQMAGNVWQWCRDWYDPKAYSRVTDLTARPPSTRVRSERGGSWVGPINLCRSSFRRGRPPDARGRCLGFRCVGFTA